MPHEVTLITTIAASLGLALLLGLAAERIKLPPLVGYLIAGIILSPATPGFSGDLYGTDPVVEFHAYLSPSKKFDTLDELRDCINNAAQRAQDGSGHKPKQPPECFLQE